MLIFLLRGLQHGFTRRLAHSLWPLSTGSEASPLAPSGRIAGVGGTCRLRSCMGLGPRGAYKFQLQARGYGLEPLQPGLLQELCRRPCGRSGSSLPRTTGLCGAPRPRQRWHCLRAVSSLVEGALYMRAFFLPLSLGLCLMALPATAQILSGQVDVGDGDTLAVRGQHPDPPLWHRCVRGKADLQ